MKISESLIHELLELTRMYAQIPYNAIFMFVAYPQYRNIDWWEDNILSKIRLTSFPYSVECLLLEITVELKTKQNDDSAVLIESNTVAPLYRDN